MFVQTKLAHTMLAYTYSNTHTHTAVARGWRGDSGLFPNLKNNDRLYLNYETDLYQLYI